jgi:hypothetical protein
MRSIKEIKFSESFLAFRPETFAKGTGYYLIPGPPQTKHFLINPE